MGRQSNLRKTACRSCKIRCEENGYRRRILYYIHTGGIVPSDDVALVGRGKVGPKGDKGDPGAQGPAGPSYTLPAANKTTLGGVKQMALIADLSTETATDLKNKINAILAEMKKQGIMAN